MEAVYFNLGMINVFVGLLKNHRFLRPYSTKIIQLGYNLYKIEPSFYSLNSDRRVNPEAIAISEFQQHTLLTEWTTAKTINEKKKEQLQRYKCINNTDLTDFAQITLPAAKECSVLVAVQPESIDEFRQFTDQLDKEKILLCSFSYFQEEKKYKIIFHSGNLLDEKLSYILKNNLVFDRIPSGYITFPLDDFQHPYFKDSILQQLLSFIAKEIYIISTEDICTYILGDLWDYIDDHKKISVQRAIKQKMNILNENKYVYIKEKENKWVLKNNAQKLIDFFKSDLI